jgi:lysophospholipase L1-like esterase
MVTRRTLVAACFGLALMAVAGWLVVRDGARADSPTVVVAFGDSLTEGAPSDNYPARLAQRLGAAERDGGAPASVLNAGLSGNKLLSDQVGPRGLRRFARDALGRPGVTHVIVLIGTNDIGWGVLLDRAGLPGAAEATEIQAGLEQLVAQAHGRGVKLILGTLPPFKGAVYWGEGGERRRQALNQWIRNQRIADGVVDFDAALRSASDPQMLDAALDSGDHLHPGGAGYAAMAAAVDLDLLRRR